jgi:hypothetical protein
MATSTSGKDKDNHDDDANELEDEDDNELEDEDDTPYLSSSLYILTYHNENDNASQPALKDNRKVLFEVSNYPSYSPKGKD